VFEMLQPNVNWGLSLSINASSGGPYPPWETPLTDRKTVQLGLLPAGHFGTDQLRSAFCFAEAAVAGLLVGSLARSW
jgi:hypothetical protein